MLGGVLFYARVGTIRMRPWKAVPFTNGQYRTPVDVALYLGLLASLVTAIVVPAGHPGSLHEALRTTHGPDQAGSADRANRVAGPVRAT